MDGLISATVKYSNKDDASRVYDISADISITSGKMTGCNNGMVTKKGETMGSGNFATGGESDYISYNTNGWGKEDTIGALEAIYEFIGGVKENISKNQTINA